MTILFCVIAELDKKVPTPADGQMNQMKQAQDKGIVSNIILCHCGQCGLVVELRPRGYKKNFMLSSD